MSECHLHYGQPCQCDWVPPLLFPTPYRMCQVTFVDTTDYDNRDPRSTR